MSYPMHTPDTAPEAAKEPLAKAQRAFGFVPNLLAVMASAPTLLKAYMTLGALFDESSFTPAERQVVLLEVSYQNGCDYCVAAHTVIAGMQGVPASAVDAVRGGHPIADQRLEALRQFTAAVVESRGWPSENHTRAFFGAGYTQAQALEVILGVGMKTLSNYTNHIAGTPLDAAFSKAAWSKAA